MILYFADRAFNILGLAGDKIKRGYNIENDEEEIDIESGVATFSFDIYYTEDKRSEVEKITYAGNYILRKDKNDFKTYTIIDTEQSTENMSINVRAEDMGLDLINDVCMPFNYETADFNDQTDYAYEGNAGHIGYINESGEYVADQNYRATNYIDLPSTLPEACLFRVSKTETGSKRYSTAFYDTNKNFISGSGKYYYLSDSEQVSRVDIPLTAKYARISFHKDITSAFFIPSSVKSYDISTYIGLCITNSGFEVGINEIGETRIPLEFEDTQTASERINEIVGYFEAEFGFSFEFDGMTITKKAINLYKHRGTDNRVELRLGREVKNIRINRSVAELATAIIPIGTAVNENGEDVYFSLQGYDGEIESGYYIEDNMLCSSKAFSKWSRYLSASGRRSGHIVKKFEYECSTQKTLYEYALSDLKAIEDAATTYEVELYSLPDSVSLGDTVYVVDDAGEIYISARVFRIRKSEINDTIVTELGDFVTRSSGIVDEWSIFRQKFAAWSEANSAKYVWVAYADDNQGTGISISPTGKNWMGLADNQKTKNVDLSDPSIFNWIQLTAKDGKDGNDGAGVRSTTVSYAVSTSPNVMPGQNDWGSTIPNVPKGQVLWVRTVTDYTDDNIPDTVTYSYSIQGNDGQPGSQGAPGTNGVSVTVDRIEYVSWPTNQQPPNNAQWQSTIPLVLPGDYLWTRTTFSDNNVIYGLARQGEDGEDGESVTISSTTKSGETTTIIFSDGTSIQIKDGEDGTDGTPGTPGTDGTPSYMHIAWANSADGITDFSTSVSNGKSYLGTYTDSIQADSQTPSKYKWSLIKGADGRNGTSVTITDISTTDGTTTVTFSDGNQIIISDGEDGLPGSPGINGVSNYIHIAWANSADGTVDFSTSVSTGKKYFGTYKDTNSTDSQSPSSYHWSLIKGSDGTSVTVTKTEYQSGTSPTTAPSGSWSTTIPSVPEGNYLWTKVTYSDGKVAYSVAKQGVSGTNGTNGQDGTSVTVTNTAYAYQLSTSGTTVPTGTWKSTPQAPTTTQFAWTRTTITFSDNSTAVTYTVGGKTGTNGQDGYSPTAVVNKSNGVATITITDKNGTTTQTITDGVDGTPGAAGADGRTSYFHVKYSNDGGQTFTGNSGEDLGKWMGHYTDFTQADSTNVSNYTWIKIEGEDGEDGADGVSITSVVNHYLATSSGSGVTRSTSGWTTSVQTMTSTKQYLWNYETINYSSGNSTNTDPVIIGRYGQNGTNGTNGINGQDGRGIASITEHYQVSASNTTAPSTWSDTMVNTTTTNKYLWNYETITYTDGNTEDTTKRVIGTHGETGTSVTVSKTEYQSGTSATTAPTGTWSTSPVTVAAGNYLWTKVTYSDSKIAYSVAKQGQNGTNGTNGTSVTVTGTEYAYQLSTSGTTIPTGTWQTTPQAPTTTQYAWTRTTVTFSDTSTAVTYTVGGKTGQDGKRGAEWYTGTGITGTSTSPTIFRDSGVDTAVVGDMYLNTSTYNTYRCTNNGIATVAKWVYVNNIKGIKGDPGTNGTNGTNGINGDDGRGVSSIDREYYLSTSNTSQTGGSWKTTPDAYVSGRYYWSRDKIVWTNPTGTTYTTAVLDNGLNSANSNASSAVSTANTANTNASNAVSTANTANSTANTAKSTADTAKSTAETAKSTANTAKSTADTAKSTADSANSKIDNLQIGGRNLLKGTGNYSEWNAPAPAESCLIRTTEYIRFNPYENKVWWWIEPHDAYIPIDEWDTTAKYTASIDIKFEGLTTRPAYPSMTIMTAKNNTTQGYGSRVYETSLKCIPSTQGDWVHYTYTFDGDYTKWTQPGSGESLYVKGLIWLYINSSEVDAVYIRNFKLEKGNRATDWTPAPEDFEDGIANAQAAADAASVEYIVGTQTAKTGAWKGVTRDSSLVAGKTIAYKLPYEGSGNASLTLTLSGGNTTSAIAVYLNTTRVTTHFGAGAVIQMTYDGTYWRVTSIPNSNDYDRRLHNNYIKAAAAITKNYIICGTSAGYKNVAAGVEFDISYPILWTDAAIASGGQGTAYEAYPGVNPSTTATVEGLAINQTLWLKVEHLGGSRFSVAQENFLTCVTPTTSDAHYYIPLGVIANDSTAKLYFATNDRLYSYVNGEFQALDTASILESRRIEASFTTYVDEANGTFAGLRTEINSVTNDVNSLTNDITEASTRISTLDSTLSKIVKYDSNGNIIGGYLGFVTQSIDNLTNRITRAEGYMTDEGWTVEDSNNTNTKTIMSGNGLKVVSNETGNDSVYLEVNSVNSTINNTTITGYANIAGYSIQVKEETEYDGTTTAGMAFNS